MTDEELRAKIKPYLIKKGEEADDVLEEFLNRLFYRSGEGLSNFRHSECNCFCRVQHSSRVYRDHYHTLLFEADRIAN